MIYPDYLAFEGYLYRKGEHQHTVQKHLKNLKHLQTKIEKYSELDSFLAGLKKANKSHACINSYIDTIRLLIDCFNLPIEKPKHVKKLTTHIKQTLTTEQIQALINMKCPQRWEKYQFQKFSLFIRILAETGCRPGELAQVTIHDFQHDKLLLEHTKTGKPRIVPINRDIASTASTMRLEEFIVRDDTNYDSRGKSSTAVIVEPNRGYIFTTSTRRLYSDHSWEHAFDKRLKFLGLKKPGITIYSLRHSFATECRRQKMELDMLSQIMGSSVEMIAKTYSHLDISDLRIALSRHPLLQKNADPKDMLKAFNETLHTFGFLDDNRFKSSITDTGKSISATIEIACLLLCVLV